MKTHNKKILELNLNRLLVMGATSSQYEENIRYSTELAERYQQEGDKAEAAVFAEYAANARQYLVEHVQRIAEIKAEIMELCHD